MIRCLAAAIAGAISIATVSLAAAAATTSELDEIHLAKIGLAEFLVAHVDRPLRISEACPTLPAASAAAHVSAIGLVPSTREYGTAVVFDGDVGGGLVAVRCGVDVARGAEPPGSSALSTDVAMLDGQATFDHLAVAIGGDDVVVTEVVVAVGGRDQPGRQAARCTNGGRDCAAALAVDDLTVTVRMRGLPADTGEQLVRQLTVAVTPEIVTNLAGLAPTDGQ